MIIEGGGQTVAEALLCLDDQLHVDVEDSHHLLQVVHHLGHLQEEEEEVPSWGDLHQWLRDQDWAYRVEVKLVFCPKFNLGLSRLKIKKTFFFIS